MRAYDMRKKLDIIGAIRFKLPKPIKKLEITKVNAYPLLLISNVINNSIQIWEAFRLKVPWLVVFSVSFGEKAQFREDFIRTNSLKYFWCADKAGQGGRERCSKYSGLYDWAVHRYDLHGVIVVQKAFFTSGVRGLTIDHHGFIWHGFDKTYEFILFIIHFKFLSINI